MSTTSKTTWPVVVAPQRLRNGILRIFRSADAPYRCTNDVPFTKPGEALVRVTFEPFEQRSSFNDRMLRRCDGATFVVADADVDEGSLTWKALYNLDGEELDEELDEDATDLLQSCVMIDDLIGY